MHTEYLDYSAGKDQFEGFASYDNTVEKKRPCVVICHAWAGQMDFERDRAVALAKSGYVGFAIDVYGKGVRGSATEDNSHLMKPLLDDREKLIGRLKASIDFVAGHKAVDPDKIAVIGYCFGGLCALDLARSGDATVKGAVSFHGVFYPPTWSVAEKITAKVLILHGYDDPMATPEQMIAVADELTKAKADWQIHAYGSTLHAFAVPGANMPENGVLYNASADRRSWQSLENFLTEVFA